MAYTMLASRAAMVGLRASRTSCSLPSQSGLVLFKSSRATPQSPSSLRNIAYLSGPFKAEHARTQKRNYATSRDVGATSGPAEPIDARPAGVVPSSDSSIAAGPSAATIPPSHPGLPHASHITSAGVSSHPSVGIVQPVNAGQSTPSGGGNFANDQGIIIERPKRSRTRKWVVRFARTILAIVLGTGSYILYRGYIDRHPRVQLPHDPAKKNLIVLGNGWASTSLLKGIDTENYNVTVISPRNYFLFTPLLPSVTVGTLESRSIIEPTRFITRHKTREVHFCEGEATDVDLKNRTVTVTDNSDIKGEVATQVIPYDYLVMNVGAANQTFGIKGVQEHACFLKEAWDAEKIRTRLMDCVETASFRGQTPEEQARLLHMVVVGGGPSGVEFAAELHDFLKDDLATWYPDISDKIRITLVEALPNVLPMFSKQLIDYTSATFKENKIDVLTRTMVKEVTEKTIIAQDDKKNLIDIPYGLLVWVTGNTSRPITRKVMEQIGSQVQNQRRGLVVDERLKVAGTDDVFACGDATATSYSPTAQVASQQGKYLARIFNQLAKKEELEEAITAARQTRTVGSSSELYVDVEHLVKQYNRVATLRPFNYSHQGSLAYIGSDRAIADIPFFNGNVASGGAATFLFWRSAYISNLFSLRNRSLVILDWIKVKVFGRDVSRE